MKTFIRLSLALFVLFVMLVASVLVILTRPGVQKRLVESQLPEGSSIRTVRVTTSSLEFSQLQLALPDGTRVRLESFETDFKPLDALFHRTVKLGALNVDGLLVEIPQALIDGPVEVEPPVDRPLPPQPRPTEMPDVSVPVKQPAPKKTASPMDALYAIGQLDWLIDIESINVDGELRDGAGSRYVMDLRSGAIRPGQETTIEASLKLSAAEALHAGLKEFDASASIFLNQKMDGGFDMFRVESLTNASDASGNKLLAVSQKLEVAIEGFQERASLVLDFNADLPRPEFVLPELAGFGPLGLEGSLAAGAERDLLTLSATDLSLSVEGEELVSVKLNKQFALVGQQTLSGNLMDLQVTNLPLAWLAPWLPAGLTLVGEDLSAQFNLTGIAGGELELSSTEPLRIGPLSLAQDGVPLLDQVSIVTQPVFRFAQDQALHWELSQLQVLDRYGEFLSGQSTGQFDPSQQSDGFFPAGLQAHTKLELGLQEITQQPVLAEYASILSGRASLDLKVASQEEHPLQLQGRMIGLSPRAYPGQRQDYRFALQVNEPSTGQLALRVNLQVGSESRPSSNLQLAGQVRPESTPMEFKADLTAERVMQRDLEFLLAAFQPAERTEPDIVPDDRMVAPTPTPGLPRTPPSDRAAPPVDAAAPAPPPWAGYDGKVSLSVAELVLLSGELITDLTANATVTEPLLSLNQLQATLRSGQVSAEGEARYSSRQRMAYVLRTDLSFDDVDPAVFSKKPADTFPVRGLFNGRAELSGQGETLEQALEAIEGEVLVTGREGVLTAFKLDNRSNLGLIGVGLLGDRLNRPGITALAETVPYFENMPFSDFTLRLNRSSDRRIMIPELRFVGRNVLIDGAGSIAATSLKDAMSQPLDLKLQLGAKGKLIDHLETLRLLGPNTGEDGFRRWANAIQIRGSLSDPDTSALERVLREAANRALTQSGRRTEAPRAGDESASEEGEAPSEQNLQQPKPTREERILRDVESGLNLLFGR